jgi:cysteine-rich repeat protein
MRRFWLFPSFVLLAAGCPSDDTSETNDATDTDETEGDDDNDDDADDDDSDTSETLTTDPDSSSDGGSSSVGTDPDSSTTVAGPVCGDGVMDEGEECDDENMDNGDDCSAECTIPFEVLWTATHNGSASNQDFINEVIVAADGNIYAAGSERNTNTGADVWVRQYMPDGTEGWTFTFDGADGLDDSAAAIAFDADGNLLVAGTTESAATVEDILVLQVDVLDGTSNADPVIIDGSGSGAGETDDDDFATDVAIDPTTGFIVATGAVRVDAESWNIWVAEIDPAAMPSPVVWEQTLNGPDSGQDTAQQVHVADDGTVYVLANQQLEDNSTQGLVLVYGDDGTPQDADTVELDYIVSDFAFDGDGNVAIAGSAEPGNSGYDIVVNFYDPAFTLEWTAAHDGPAHTDDFGRAVAFDAAGHVAVVGPQAVPSNSADAWVGTYQVADGAPWWGDSHQSDSELDDAFSDVAVTPDGDFVVAGSESVLGQQRNAFIRVYRPL